MAVTYDSIATTTLNSAQSSVSFSSFSGYTDLVVVMSIKNGTGTNYNTYIKFNDDNGTNYSVTYMYGTGSAIGSSRDTNNSAGIRVGYSNSTYFSANIFSIQNYSNSTTFKTVITRANDNQSVLTASIGLWRNTNAITSFTLTNEGGANFASGSTFTLYGIKAA